MKNLKVLITILNAVFMNVSSVKITKISVPSTYVIDYNYCRPLILDCDYEFRLSDVGFVLKWYHNSHLIYQWIPPRKPYIFSSFKYHINTSFISNNDDSKYKYKGIQLKPHYNLTGDWMCSVQTYSTRDRQIKRMQVIGDPSILIIDKSSLTYRINNNYSVISEERSECDENGFYNKSIMARIDKNFIQSPSAISCILEINGTDYIKKKRFIYYDYKYDKNHPDVKKAYSSRHSINGSTKIYYWNNKLLSLFILTVFMMFVRLSCVEL